MHTRFFECQLKKCVQSNLKAAMELFGCVLVIERKPHTTEKPMESMHSTAFNQFRHPSRQKERKPGDPQCSWKHGAEKRKQEWVEKTDGYSTLCKAGFQAKILLPSLSKQSRVSRASSSVGSAETPSMSFDTCTAANACQNSSYVSCLRDYLSLIPGARRLMHLSERRCKICTILTKYAWH